jgi:hypothetical protein
VLADRRQVVKRAIEQAYPVTRKARLTYSGSGCGTGYAKGQQADLGAPRLPGTGPGRRPLNPHQLTACHPRSVSIFSALGP